MTAKDVSKKIDKITGLANELSELKQDGKLINKTIKYLNEYKTILQKSLDKTEVEVEV